jgi:putative transposase
MNALYSLCGISKQGHWEAVKRERTERAKEPLYLGFIVAIRQMHPGMGLRKMYDQFSPEGIGRDAFIALGLREGYRLRAVETPQRTTRSVKSARYTNLLEGKQFTNVNQLWVSDLFYFPLQGRHYYVVLIMDVYSRRIVGYCVADNMRAVNNISALNMALTLRGISKYGHTLIHHSDRGSQYISDDYTNLLSDYEIRISMCADVLENAHCERVNGTIKNEYLNRWPIDNFYQLKKYLKLAVDNYNNRWHHSLKMTPIEFETYVKELPEDQRPILEVFTSNKKLDNAMQLVLNFGS